MDADSLPPWQSAGKPNVWMPYCQMKTAPLPKPVVATEGCELILADGTRLIDGMASWWSAVHGYNHPHIVAAMKKQIDVMPHVMLGGIHHQPALDLARRLSGILPGDLNRVFFSDSGSVAVEVAMKMAIQYFRNQGDSRKHRFISFHNAYHGDTTGAMSLCDPDRSMHRRFGNALLQQLSCPIPCCDETENRFIRLLAEHQEQIAGVFIEPLVQGAGGMRIHQPSVLQFLRKTCDHYRVLLIADELATGFGRTGSMFAIDQADMVPDIICLGKALTAGAIGMAATIASDQVFEEFWSDKTEFALMHGPTFMANPLACSAANASLDLFQTQPRLEQAQAMEVMMRDLLLPCMELPQVIDVRCKGAIAAIQVERLYQVDRLRQSFVEQGVWLRPFGDVIYATPPLSISQTQLAKICESMVSVVSRWAHWDG